MKIPKTRNMYCRKCKKHTEHKVSEAKRKTMGSTHTQSYGSETRARMRGKKRGFGNLGRYSRKAKSAWKMSGRKVSTKIDLRYTCKDCKKTWGQNHGIRAKKVEFKQ